MRVLALTQARSRTQAQSSTPAISQAPPVSSSENGSYVVTGKPAISAGFLNRVLAAYGPPASSKGQALYALAFFLHESRFGTGGETFLCFRVTWDHGFRQTHAWPEAEHTP